MILTAHRCLYSGNVNFVHGKHGLKSQLGLITGFRYLRY